MGYKKNGASQFVTFAAVKNSDGTALTGLSITIKRSLDGGAQATGGGSVTELAGGQYSYAYAQADLNALDCSIYFTGTNMIPVNYTVVTDTKLVSELTDLTSAQTAAAVLTSTVTGTTYATGEVGYLLSNYLNASIATLTTNVAALPTAAQNATAVWTTTVTGTTYATGEAGYLLATYLNAPVSGASAPTAAAVATAVWTTYLTGTTYAYGEAGYLLSQSINPLVNGSSALSVVANSATLTTGTATNTYTSTQQADGTSYQIAASGASIDVYLEYSVTSTGLPVNVGLRAGLAGVTTSIGVYAYDFAGVAWFQIGSIPGMLSLVLNDYEFDIPAALVGTGGSAGLVRVRFYAASGLTAATLYIDQALVSYTVPAPTTAQIAAAVPTAANMATAVWTTTLTGTTYAFGEAGYLLTNASAPTAAQVATAVWTQTLLGTTYAAGEAGYLLSNVSTLTAAQVWSEVVPGVYGAGEAGNTLGNIATGTPPTAAAIAAQVWVQYLTGTTYAYGEAGYLLSNSGDKTGYKLAADGLDSITNTDPAAERPANFREALAWLFRRFGNKVAIDRNAGTITTYKDDSTTILSVQPYTQSSTQQEVDAIT